MSHSDMIKVSSKIKLRSTAQKRSPGGTPKRVQRDDSHFAVALRAKFMGATGHRDRQSLSPGTQPLGNSKRRSLFGAGPVSSAAASEVEDVSENEWNTD